MKYTLLLMLLTSHLGHAELIFSKIIYKDEKPAQLMLLTDRKCSVVTWFKVDLKQVGNGGFKMKQQYQDFNFRSAALQQISLINLIIDEYVNAGYVLTVRQLYYQLVARGHIENTERSYKNTVGLVNNARLAGLLDWEAIEDRTRAFIKKSRWSSGGSILRGSAEQFHMDMWDNQQTRVFCIVEKEALVGVLESVCFKYDVPLLAARGYPSASVLREFARDDIIDRGQRLVILHLGDHDPSGIDMTRDLTDRLYLLSDGGEFELIRIALNMDQIHDQGPPPNPAKTTDARFASYKARYGDQSWELDALNPRFLSALVTNNIDQWIDQDLWVEKEEEIEAVKKRIAAVAADFD